MRPEPFCEIKLSLFLLAVDKELVRVLAAILGVEQVKGRLETFNLVLLHRALVHHVVEVAGLEELDLEKSSCLNLAPFL